MFVWAFRYFFGRKTGDTERFAKELERIWHQLDEPDKDCIRRDLYRKFVHVLADKEAYVDMFDMQWIRVYDISMGKCPDCNCTSIQ